MRNAELFAFKFAFKTFFDAVLVKNECLPIRGNVGECRDLGFRQEFYLKSDRITHVYIQQSTIRRDFQVDFYAELFGFNVVINRLGLQTTAYNTHTELSSPLHVVNF